MVNYDLHKELSALRNEMSKLGSEISGIPKRVVNTGKRAVQTTGGKIKERPKTSLVGLIGVLLIGVLVGIFLYRDKDSYIDDDIYY